MPDVPLTLELQLSGKLPLDQDFEVDAEVELAIRGVVTADGTVSKRSAGQVTGRVKTIKVEGDELLAIRPAGQAAEPSQEELNLQAIRETAERLGIEPHLLRVNEAGAVEMKPLTELEAAAEPPSPSSAAAASSLAAEPEPEPAADPDEEEQPEAPPPERHPQIPEPAWAQLNLAQKGEVLELVHTYVANVEYLAGVSNPTDREVTEKKIGELDTKLKDDFGIELIDIDDVKEADESFREIPPPVTVDSPPLTVDKLQARRGYLLSKRALPQEALEARNAEIAVIERRLRAQGGTAA